MNVSDARNRAPSGGPVLAILYGVLLAAILLGAGQSMSQADDAYGMLFPDNTEIFPPYGKTCVYGGITAACGQLQIKFRTYRNVAAIQQVIRILEDCKAERIGQSPSMGILWVSVPEEKILQAREDLKKIGVATVTFVVRSSPDCEK